ncbi:MAG: DMT family transporter, partial [Pseudomonadota bacterium]
LAQVFALEFTTPIWVALLGPLLIGERFTTWRCLAAVLGFAGVLAVAQPGVGEFGVGQAVALAAAIGFAGNVLATKQLSKTETTLSILFWMTASQGAMAAVCDAAASGAEMLPWPSAENWLWLVIVGFCGLAAHFSIASALRHADATVVAPMDFFRLPLIAAVGAALYAEPLDPLVFAGGAVIFLGNFLNIRAETRRVHAPRG